MYLSCAVANLRARVLGPVTQHRSCGQCCCAQARIQVHTTRHAWPTSKPALRGSRKIHLAAQATSEEEEYEPDMDCMERMDKSLQACEKELIGIRAGVVAFV